MTPLAERVAECVPTDARPALDAIYRAQADLELFAEMLRRDHEDIPMGAMVYLAAMNVGLERYLPSLRRH